MPGVGEPSARLPTRDRLVEDLRTTTDIATLHHFLDIVDKQPRGRAEGLRILLQVCAELGIERFVRELVLRGADVNKSTNKTLPALLYALRGDHKEVVEFLLNRGARRDVADVGGKNALMYAATYGTLDILRLVYRGDQSELKVRDRKGKTAVLHAASHGRTEAIDFLIYKGSDIDDVDQAGNNCLMLAAAMGSAASVVSLIDKHHCRLELVNSSQLTALSCAAANDRVETVRALLYRGANRYHADADEKTPLVHTISGSGKNIDRKVDVIDALLDGQPSVGNLESARCLTLAALAGQNQILRKLLEHGANVQAQDESGKTALLHIASDTAKTPKWDKETVAILLCAYPDYGIDFDVAGQERTPLHWAAARGHYDVMESVLNHLSGLVNGVNRTKQYVDYPQERGKTALHLAAKSGHNQTVQLLLKHNAEIDALSEGNWTPLLVAAFEGHASTAKVLLEAQPPANVNARTTSGMTALHWAAENGHKGVVELLLAQPEVQTSPKDTFDTTPLLRACRKDHKAIVDMFKPHLFCSSMPQDAQHACDLFTASVADFYIRPSETRPENRKLSVREVLYDLDKNDPKRFAITTKLKEIKAGTKGATPDFRWIHLPANNLAWVEALITKMLMEDGLVDVSGYSSMLRLFGQQQHRGSKVHSRFMRPLCQVLPSEYAPSSRTRRIPRLSRTDSSVFEEPLTPVGLGISTNLKNSQPRTSVEALDTGSNPFGVIFMPYLHWETDSNRAKLRKTTQEVLGKVEKSKDPMQQAMKKEYRDECLLRGYLLQGTDLHLRRTLDQFKHHSIDTGHRDRDQVVYRHFKELNRKKPHKYLDPRIFMIDQLWMFVFDDILLTCFPERVGQPIRDPLSLFDGVISDLVSRTYPQIKSTSDLAAAVTRRCVGAFDRHQWGHHDVNFMFFEIFELAIGTLTRRTTALLKRFESDSTNAAKWLHDKHFRSTPEGNGAIEDKTMEDLENEEDEWLNDDHHQHSTETHAKAKRPQHDSTPPFVNRLLDIQKETKLLIECKDIEDELSILTLILEQQRDVLKSMGEAFAKSGLKRPLGLQKRMVEQHLLDISRMDKSAQIVNRSLTQVLDLKQKHANAFEARSARAQAEDTARQGLTIMVFTVVTVIFLPLSFMAAFFAINITEVSSSICSSSGVDEMLTYIVSSRSSRRRQRSKSQLGSQIHAWHRLRHISAFSGTCLPDRQYPRLVR